MSEFFWMAEDVRAAAKNGWKSVLGNFGAGAELLSGGHSACPGCGGRDRFRFDDKEGAGTWLCSQGGGGVIAGDGIDLVAHIKNVEWKVAVNLVGREVCPEKGKPCGSGLPKANESSRMRSRPEDRVQEAPEAEEAKPGVMKFDIEALRRFCRPDLRATVEWFAERSPISPEGLAPASFLEAVFEPDEKVLIFTNERSQGQFLHWCGHGSFRLADRPGVKAVRSALPRGEASGVFFLCQPVTGKWCPNPRAKLLPNGEMKLSRRSMESVSDWRYMVLESDEAPDELWMNLLAQLPLPLAAIYTSGRRSIHALVKLRVRSKPEWDMVKKSLGPLLSKLGADNGALSAVRLTRLPGCYRGGKEQRLLYLDPSPDSSGVPIHLLGARVAGD